MSIYESRVACVVPCRGYSLLLLQVLGELSSKGCGCVMVVDAEKRLLGTFTDGDLRRTLQHRQAQVLLEAHPRVALAAWLLLLIMEGFSFSDGYGSYAESQMHTGDGHQGPGGNEYDPAHLLQQPQSHRRHAGKPPVLPRLTSL